VASVVRVSAVLVVEPAVNVPVAVKSKQYLPLTVITGIYGMNFEDMPELRWRYGYPATLVGMAAVMVGLAWYFKRKDWW